MPCIDSLQKPWAYNGYIWYGAKITSNNLLLKHVENISKCSKWYSHSFIIFFIVYNDGTTKDLMSLSGTIPIMFNGNNDYAFVLWHEFWSVQTQNKKDKAHNLSQYDRILIFPLFLHEIRLTTSRCACGLRKPIHKLLPFAMSDPRKRWCSSKEIISPAMVKFCCLTWRSGKMWELNNGIITYIAQCWHLQPCYVGVTFHLPVLGRMWPHKPHTGDGCHVWRFPSCLYTA